MCLKHTLLLVFALAMALLQTGCMCSAGDAEREFVIPDSLKQTQVVAVSDKVMENMVENISSPVETAALIKRLNVPFNKDMLIPTDASDRFNTNFQKALALGLYGTDLGYLNMYEKTSLVISYISSVKSLADGIQVGQFFDFSTLKRLATNNENLDSLIHISQESYNKIDGYLRSTNRSSLSVVIVTGVWIEGMYISTMVAQQTKNEQMEETVLDQKIVLSTLLQLLRLYDRDADMQALADRLEKLKELYDNVRITIEPGEPETRVDEKTGMLTIIQTDKQIVDAAPETIAAIMESVLTLRNELIAGK